MIRTKVIVGVFLVYFTMVFSSSVNASVELSMDEGKAMMNSKKINEALQKAGKSKVVAEKVVTLPKGTFLLARTVVVPPGVTLRGAGLNAMPILKVWQNNQIPVVKLGSDTKLENVVIDGQGMRKSVNLKHNGVEIVGASANQRVRNVQILNSRIQNFDGNGIFLKYTDRVRIVGVTQAQMMVSNIGYAGIIGYSANNTTIQKVTVRDIGVLGQRWAYNIALTEVYDSKLAAGVQAKVNPRSEGALITDSYILNNAVWEGIDTHHGRNLVIQNNTILNVRNAIAIVSITLAGDAGTVSPPQNVVIRNNRINKQSDYMRLKLARSEKFKTVRGIVVSGAKLKKSRDAVYATGIQVLNNQVENVQAISVYAGGIVIQATFGAIVSGNRIQLESSGRTNYNGIVLTANNKRASIVGNYIGRLVSAPIEGIVFRGGQNNGEWNNAKWSKVSGYGMLLSKNYRGASLFANGSLNTRNAKLVMKIADTNDVVVRNTNNFTFKK